MNTLVTTLKVGNRNLPTCIKHNQRYNLNTATRKVIVELYPQLKGFKSMVVGDVSTELNKVNDNFGKDVWNKMVKRMNVNVVDLDFDLINKTIRDAAA